MKSSKFTLAGMGLLAVTLVFGAPASAADLNVGGSMKDAPAYMPRVNWAGFYIGLHAGGARDKVHNVETSGGYNGTGTTINFDDTSFFGGGQAGYNLQQGALVFGIEADLGYMGLDDSAQLARFIGNPDRTGDSIASIDGGLYATLTGRLGVGFDRVLIYAKGGLALLDADLRFSDLNPTGATLDAKSSDTLTGWVLGGGVEYALDAKWTMKAEYLHFDFGSENLAGVASVDETITFKDDVKVDTVKLGVNYRFGGDGPEPLK